MTTAAGAGRVQIIHTNDVRALPADLRRRGRFGDPATGRDGQLDGLVGRMDWWEDGFCQQLAAQGRLVIRYDYRDTGRSVSYPAGSPPYGLDDLVGDSVGLLDVLRTERAHIAGISMGGVIGQRPQPDWTSRAVVIEHIADRQQALAGTVSRGTARFRQIAARVVDRTANIAASLANHWRIDPGQPYRPRLSQITAPALVIHGTEDPLLSYQHAENLAREITGIRLLS